MNLVIGGSGPPVLLLHGYPQTHAMWHAVALLARDLTVVAADLRSYGTRLSPIPARTTPATRSGRWPRIRSR